MRAIPLVVLLSACSNAPDQTNSQPRDVAVDTRPAPDAGAVDSADEVDAWSPPDNCASTHDASLPDPGGTYCVGVSSVVLNDPTRADPITGAAEREVVVHLWYPTYTPDGEAYHPLEATIWQALNLPGSPDEFVANAIVDAPLARGDQTFGVLIFMPGFTAPVGIFASWLEYFASRGWVVAAIEHPGVSLTRYPDGTVLAANRPATEAEVETMLTDAFPVVVDDALFVRGELENADAMPIDPGRLAVETIGYLGESYGGATAVAACELDAGCAGSINVDGQFFQGEPPVFDVLTKPWGIILSEGRFHDQAMPSDDTLVQMWSTTTAEKFYAELSRTTHLGISDLLFVFAAFGQPAPPALGTIHRLDQYESVTQILGAFFDVRVLGSGDVTVSDAAAAFPFVSYGE